jgi:fatty-acyl-CoA synthase
MPYAGWMVGADLILPGRFLQAEPLARLVEAERPTFSGGVPVIWNDILRFSEEHDVDLSSLRLLVCGGVNVPASFIKEFRDKLGVRIAQGWGMTETGPTAAVNLAAPKRSSPKDSDDWLSMSGRILPGVQMRIVDDAGDELPWDGNSTGEFEVRGQWVTSSYFGSDDLTSFHEGWLRTGDIGVGHANGYMHLTDRRKDIIKSGGEWISSIELEARLKDHPNVIDAAVIAVADERWQERPLACVVLVGSPDDDTIPSLREHLRPSVPSFWVPEYWAFVAELPRTSVGKIDKLALREAAAAGLQPYDRIST